MAAPTNIFSLSGQPLHVFVEASGVQSRPKLIRSLRNAGAVVCYAPSDAQVILVDSSTPEGIQFVREWSNDTGKVVLESKWAGKCIRMGRLLWSANNWGGCACTLSSDEQTVIQNPANEDSYPTPSPTPTRPDSKPSSSASAIPPLQSQPIPSSSSYSANAAATFPLNYASSLSPFERLQSPQYSQSPGVASQYSQFGTPPPSMPQQQMQQPQFAPSQITPQMAAMLPAMPQVPGHMLPEMLNNFMMAYMLQPQYHQMLHAVQQSQVSRMSYTVPAASQPLVEQQPFSPGGSSTMPPPSASVAQPVASSSRAPRTSDSAFSKTMSSSRKRKAPSSSSYSPSPSASSRATPSGLNGKERAYSSSESDEDEDEDKTLSPSRVTGSSPSDSAPQRRVLAPRKEGHIFETDAGTPLLFHVQVDLKNRMQVVQAIKKNGGKVTSDIEDADYIILYIRSKTFNILYDSTEAKGKFPIQASFVMDCVEEKALLDHNHYILEHPDPKCKRKKAKVTKTNSKPRSKTSGAAKSPTKPRSKPRPKPKKIVPVTDDADYDFDRDLHSPPPPTNEFPMPSGKYPFTDEEKDYAKMYIELCLKRDPTTSGNRIAQQLARKMPAHSPSSWHATVARMNVFTDATRKRILTERAEAKAAADASAVADALLGATEDEALDGAGDETYRHELNILTNFLMTNDLNESEADTFARLESQAHCQTSSSWVQFYDEHFEDITRALGVDANGQPGPAHPAALYKTDAKDEEM
ncbi:hypothetical protein OE88DRAFT_1650539 [Heliocybe sulcata]|uniref:BRCT domain-containing protein n=1 Tax=Heliocybe sulcata TaxID=5364 RepID=A0A5C3NI94_9AGAM|nr:hypothetical protein OE88DRAFT_1650539 [Heliocybe sulcata]